LLTPPPLQLLLPPRRSLPGLSIASLVIGSALHILCVILSLFFLLVIYIANLQEHLGLLCILFLLPLGRISSCLVFSFHLNALGLLVHLQDSILALLRVLWGLIGAGLVNAPVHLGLASCCTFGLDWRWLAGTDATKVHGLLLLSAQLHMSRDLFGCQWAGCRCCCKSDEAHQCNSTHHGIYALR